ncbi:MAG TPA: PD-(D/E)XK nuclease family protein [Candidatus Saccharimonadales bacterium]|nr:PD-(D/E)XK nuclease family protein [Candidatus Saccharimonadales bacterium]
MALTLLQGPAGSGKTHHCLERLREAQRRGEPESVRLLVPAQSAYAMRAALPAPELPVILGRPVLTFDARSGHSSLGGWALGAAAGGPGWTDALTDTARLLLVRGLLRETPPQEPRLQLSAATLGFAQELVELFAEWKEALLSPEEVAAAFADAPAAAAADATAGRTAAAAGRGAAAEPPGERGGPDGTRARELARLYSRYRDVLAAGAACDPQDLQQRALEALRARPGRLAATHFLVDSFSHFTHWQLAVLRLLAEHAASLTVTFPYEEGRPWVYRHLENDRRLLTTDMPGGARVRTLGAPRRFRSATLERLERGLFREAAPPPPAAPAGAAEVSAFEAADPAEELEEVARRIRLLVRDTGYEYDQIAVLFRDLAPARRRVEEIFRAHGVPAFVDAREEQLHTAPARAARHILRLCARGPAAEAGVALALARSALVPGLRGEADRLELEARARGIFTAARLLEQAPALLGERSPLAAPARALGLLAGGAARRTAADWCAVVRAGLEALGAGAARRADAALFLRHQAAWQQLEELLDRLAAHHGGRPLPLEEFEGDFLELLSAGRGGEVPHVKGCVLVGDVFQSRLPEVRALFLPGLAEGMFPARPSESSLLPDADRRRIERRTGRSLPLAADRADEEYYFFYVAVTRPSERLVLSRPVADHEGSELGASPFLKEAGRALPELRTTRADLRGAHFELAVDGAALDRRLALELSRPRGPGSPTPLAVALYNARLAAGGPSPWASTPRPDRLPELAQATVSLAPTQLEDFAACPFFRFARHVLGLGEPRELAFGPREDGTVLDAVATRALREVRERGGLRALESREALAARLRALLAEELRERHAALAERPLWTARVEMLKAALDRFAGVLWAQREEGRWEPEYFQLAFGPQRPLPVPPDPRSPAEPLVLRGQGVELRLRGRMDRVDRTATEPRRLRVLDYKRSPTHAIGERLRDGRLLQAALYRLALEELLGETVEAVGHLSFKNGKLQTFGPGPAPGPQAAGDKPGPQAAGDEPGPQPAGSAPAPPSEHTRAVALELGARLAGGQIEVSPARGACEHCRLSAVCRIDLWQQLLAAGGEADADAEENGDA